MHVHQHHDAGTPRPQHVVLDIGGDIGALIVHTGPELLSTEVEISPSGDDSQRSHKEVLERIANGQRSHVLVFDNIVEGEYTLWIDNIPRIRNVRVKGGQIAELDWRALNRRAT